MQICRKNFRVRRSQGYTCLQELTQTRRQQGLTLSAHIQPPLSPVRRFEPTVAGSHRWLESGPRTKDKGQRTKDKGQRTKDKGQRTKDKGQRTKDKGQRTKAAAPLHPVEPCTSVLSNLARASIDGETGNWAVAKDLPRLGHADTWRVFKCENFFNISQLTLPFGRRTSLFASAAAWWISMRSRKVFATLSERMRHKDLPGTFEGTMSPSFPYSATSANTSNRA